ncbi:hypothetical protein [Zunongwangia profunda]|uniref:hypothetical protein n=1 Tax=Zunongwangia profunda TaxID=398743 RepID=UPI0030D750DF
MELKEQTYNSLHEYLETVLKSIPNPTALQVVEAKRTYWKIYYTQYRKEKRKIRKEFTLSFDNSKLKLIHQKKGSLTVSEFLYQSVDMALDSNQNMSYDKKLLGAIDQHLVQLIDLLEELSETKGKTQDISLNEKIEALETHFHQLFKSTKS